MKTDKLTGVALDWAVAKCDQVEVFSSIDFSKKPSTSLSVNGDSYSPSTDWAQGGPIIERARIAIQPVDGYSQFSWQAAGSQAQLEVFPYEGNTALEAAMRCYVGAQFGEEIELPLEIANA